MKTSRKMKSYRFNDFVNNCVEDVCNKIGTTKTLFYEIAVIEKMARLGEIKNSKKEILNYIDNIIEQLQKAKEKIKNK